MHTTFAACRREGKYFLNRKRTLPSFSPPGKREALDLLRVHEAGRSQQSNSNISSPVRAYVVSDLFVVSGFWNFRPRQVSLSYWSLRDILCSILATLTNSASSARPISQCLLDEDRIKSVLDSGCSMLQHVVGNKKPTAPTCVVFSRGTMRRLCAMVRSDLLVVGALTQIRESAESTEHC